MQYEPGNIASGLPINVLSINLNLFFLRVMKEHCIFLEANFTPKDEDLAGQAGHMKKSYENLLTQATFLADGVVSPKAIKSGQFVTPYTSQAERMTCHFTGIPIDSSITVREKAIPLGDGGPLSSSIDARIKILNDDSRRLTARLRDFKKNLLSGVVNCKIFTANFPLELHHMLEEAEHYLKLLDSLDQNVNVMQVRNLMEELVFWNQIMAEHNMFTAGKLDPTEESAIEKSRMDAEEFGRLASRAKTAQKNLESAPEVIKESMAAAKNLQGFQTKALTEIMDCKIQSIIVPLVEDHYLRETSHFMWLLDMGLKTQI